MEMVSDKALGVQAQVELRLIFERERRLAAKIDKFFKRDFWEVRVLMLKSSENTLHR